MREFSRTQNRRDVLRTLAAFATAAVSPTSWALAEESRSPLLGFSLYGMKSVPVADALRVCAEIGYECVELAVMADWPCAPESLSATQRQELKNQLDGRGLKLAGLMENLPLSVDGDAHRKNLDRLKQAAQLSRDLVPSQTPLIETVLGGSPDKWPMLRDKFVERLRDWAKVAEECDAVIAIKPHVGGALHLPQDCADLVRTVGSKGLQAAYDFSHYQLRDLELAATWKTLAPATRFVHVKDTRGKVGAFQFLLPGEGTIDYVELIRLLKQSRYTGPVVVEVSAQISSKPGYDPIAAAKKCWPVLRDARAKAHSS